MSTTLRFVVRSLVCVSIVALAAVVVALGYRLVRADVTVALYEERLSEVASDYEDLRATYNDAVRRTAITELHVNDGALCVRVRTVEGVQRTIDTPFDPSGEIYVDYVVKDGRVWIRRVFDESTPPSQALVIDPVFADVDWDDASARLGKAVYRSLSEGRWVITVTGDGSLGLVKADDPSLRTDLVAAPEVREFDELEEEVDARVRDAGPADLWRALIGD
jgi:hypothetical protein